MREQLISFKTAKLAKEKGFSIPGENIYENEELLCEVEFKNWNNGTLCLSAPTQSLLQKWLRDNHNIIIDVVAYYDEKDLPLTKTNKPKPKGYFVWNYYDENFTEEKAIKFSDYEEALEIGLLEALNLIEKQN